MEYDQDLYDSAKDQLNWKIKRLQEHTVTLAGVKHPAVSKEDVLNAIDEFFEETADRDRTVPVEEIEDHCYVCGSEVEHYDAGTYLCHECEIYYGLEKDGSFEVADIGGDLSQNQLEELSEATGETWFLQ